MSFRSSAMVCALLLATSTLPAQWNSPDSLAFAMQNNSGGSRLGVQIRDIDSDRAAVLKMNDVTGVEIAHVEDGSPAEEAGLKAGDVLLSYNGESIVGAQQLGRLVSETPRGRKVKLEYLRNGKVSTVVATTAAPMPMAGNFPNLQSFEMPNMRAFNVNVPDIPSPLMVWRNSLLGIECETLDSQLADYFGVKHGVLVRSVIKDSPGEKAGLRAGDVITAAGDHAISDPKDLASYLRTERHAPAPLSLEIARDHKPMNIKVSALRREQ